MGGEKYLPCFNADGFVGSPPHRRGKGGTDRSGDLRHGFTPAQAGKSWNRHRPSRHSANHPRACGEKPNSRRMSSCRVGSPPRRRGKVAEQSDFLRNLRITPAWAGKSCPAARMLPRTRDHPRIGGEKAPVLSLIRGMLGSPPHRRGKGFNVARKLSTVRITPAWAGKSPASQPWSPPLWIMVIRPRP